MNLAKDHLGELDLLRLADGELNAAETEGVREHLATCAECQSRSLQFAETARAWDRFYQDEWKPSLPEAPGEWPEFADLAENRKRTVIPFRLPAGSERWLAIAASLVIAVGTLLWFARPTALSASELLLKSIAAETPRKAAPRAKVQVKTKRGGAVAASNPAEAKRINSLFGQARYDFADPLSAQAYKTWRDRLTAYRDRVEGDVARGVFVVTTMTQSSGPLEEATLELRRADYHPVQGAWRFAGGEIVEAAEAAASPQDSDRETSAGTGPDRGNAGAGTLLSPPVPASAPLLAPLSQELAVFAALHRMKADLGEPIEMERREGAEGRLTVTATGLTRERREQLRAALTEVPGVDVRFDEPRAQAMPASEATAVKAEERMEGPLAKALEGQDLDPLLDSSAAIMDRAHALRALDDRFGSGASLNAEEQRQLSLMRDDHRGALTAEVRRLRAILEPALGSDAIEGPPPPLFASAQRVDQLLHTIIATPRGDTAANSRELAVALRRLVRAVGGP